jgi:hypothetical protein
MVERAALSIRRHQIYKAKRSDVVVEISGKNGGGWRARVLTDKPGVYNGSHTLADRTLKRCYVLVQE